MGRLADARASRRECLRNPAAYALGGTVDTLSTKRHLTPVAKETALAHREVGTGAAMTMRGIDNSSRRCE
jgi:hypothetical protein